MRCEKLATRKDGFTFPCGQCASCRINRKRDWQARLLLEAAVSKFSMFVTLTIGVDDAHKDSYCTYLDKGVVQRFLKRLRKSLPAGSLRYLVVGEYGTKFGRAHYHALMFSSVPLGKDVVAKAWAQGSIDIGDVQQESIDYCLAYVLKSSKADPEWSAGEVLRRQKHPEFRLFSRGLGRAAMAHLAVPDAETGELILNREFRVLGRSWPIGRYFRDRFRGGMGLQARLRSGISDVVAESEEQKIERLLFKELRAVPFGSPAYREVWQAIHSRRQAELEKGKRKAIQAYYRNLHGHLRSRNETF